MRLTAKEAADLRLENLFLTINPVSFGSLWFVPEWIWKVTHQARGYNPHSDRAGHPGCSLRRLDSTLGPVPLLYGTSRPTQGAVPVSDVFNKLHTTYFGSLPPVPIPFSCWQGAGRIQPAEKGRITSDEEIGIMTRCVRKGWL